MSTREQQIAALEQDWASNPRWKLVKRGYSAADVVRLRGSVQPEYTYAKRGAEKLCATLWSQMAEALLFKRIATVVTDLPVGAVDEWRWTGPTGGFRELAERLGAPQLADRADRLAKKVAPAG